MITIDTILINWSYLVQAVQEEGHELLCIVLCKPCKLARFHCYQVL